MVWIDLVSYNELQKAKENLEYMMKLEKSMGRVLKLAKEDRKPLNSLIKSYNISKTVIKSYLEVFNKYLKVAFYEPIMKNTKKSFNIPLV